MSTGKRGKERGVGLRRGAGTKDEAGAGCNVIRRGREGGREGGRRRFWGARACPEGVKRCEWRGWDGGEGVAGPVPGGQRVRMKEKRACLIKRGRGGSETAPVRERR